jgi:hypothetical protein
VIKSRPDDFSMGTIIPIPKGKNVNVDSSDNYRSITLGSVFGRIFDNIVLNRYDSMPTSSELQFGFKPKRSTTMCTSTIIVKEALSYYTHHDVSVFGIVLDALKTFDKVQYTKLFSLLLKRNVPPQ